MRRRIDATKRATLALLALAMIGGSGTAVADPLDDARDLLLRAENVQATGISPTTIFIAWANTGVAADQWRIETSTTENGNYTPVATVQKCCSYVMNASPAADTSVRWIRVVPVLSVALLEGKPSPPDPAILGPREPTGLTCNDDAACEDVTNVTLKWTDNSDEQAFWIMRARGAVNPNFGAVPHATLPANTTVFNEVLAEFGVTFMYKVVAVRETNIPRADSSITFERAFGNSMSPDKIRVDTPPIPPPADPTGLTATFSGGTASLTWSDNAPGVDGFEEDGFFVEWGQTATSFDAQAVRLKRTGIGTVTWSDPNLPPDTLRCYRVRAYRNGPTYSAYSPLPTEPGVCVGSIPLAPTGLVATAVSNVQVDLDWNDASDAEAFYAVERCTGTCTATGSWTEIGLTVQDAESYTDLTVSSNRTYSYRVFGANATGRSASSNLAVVKTPLAPLAAPSTLVAVGIGSHKIEVTWVDTTTTETGFRLEFRAPGSDEWFTLVDLAANTTLHIDEFSLAPNQTRCYRVRALKGTAQSDPSNEDCGTTLGPQPPNDDPTLLSALVVSNTQTNLTWTDNATNEDGFRVELISFADQECTGQNISGIPFTRFTTVDEKVPSGIVNLSAQGLRPHTAYFWRVRAFNGDGISNPTNVVCAQTFGPKAPVFEDPAENGELDATRCTVWFRADPAETDRIKLLVIATLATGHVVDDPIYVEEPTTDATDPADRWEATYEFRKGPSYRLIATSIGFAPNRYLSASAEIRDVKVLADCPLNPDPLP